MALLFVYLSFAAKAILLDIIPCNQFLRITIVYGRTSDTHFLFENLPNRMTHCKLILCSRRGHILSNKSNKIPIVLIFVIPSIYLLLFRLIVCLRLRNNPNLLLKYYKRQVLHFCFVFAEI